ncbi:MAG: hypothetical protein K0U93_11855 [Gammaproteobacteria bacterium]|nr:hypothetical protein [Gammaproteobacteria bacterium]
MFDSLMRRLRRARIDELDLEQFHDLERLWRMRAVEVAATGRTIREIYVDIRDLTGKPLKVVIAPGLSFLARGAHQNMVACKEEVVRLKPNGTRYLTLRVACLNASRPIPGDSDNFRGVKRAPENVERYLHAASAEEPMTIQAGVWMLTDSLSDHELKERLTGVDQDGRSRAGINDHHINAARAALDRAATG